MKFSVQLMQHTDKRVQGLKTVTKNVIRALAVDLVDRSPVGEPELWKSKPPKGYVGGQLKANWQYGFNSVSNGYLPDVDRSGQISLNRIDRGLNSIDDVDGIHYLFNNMPYATMLELGWSAQAPTGMVALTVIDFPDIVKSEIARYSEFN